MPSKPQFTKIVANGKSIAIHWISRKKLDSGTEEQHNHQLECPERPRPAFDKALQAFLPFMLQIIGAPAEWAKTTEVTGISLNKEEDRRRGIVITGKRKCPFGAAPIAINTPHLRESLDDAKETGPNFLIDGMADAIDLMCQEAQAYIEGDRAQGELFETAKPKEERGKGGEPELLGDVVGRVTPEGKRGRKPAPATV